ncbi:unnamed protein product [Amoebophrya sp. A120]|nr:unnamed protein product [Amoebophrya sp. A120]|eukprot:GSA120T00015525001.1
MKKGKATQQVKKAKAQKQSTKSDGEDEQGQKAGALAPEGEEVAPQLQISFSEAEEAASSTAGVDLDGKKMNKKRTRRNTSTRSTPVAEGDLFDNGKKKEIGNRNRQVVRDQDAQEDIKSSASTISTSMKRRNKKAKIEQEGPQDVVPSRSTPAAPCSSNKPPLPADDIAHSGGPQNAEDEKRPNSSKRFSVSCKKAPSATPMKRSRKGSAFVSDAESNYSEAKSQQHNTAKPATLAQTSGRGVDEGVIEPAEVLLLGLADSKKKRRKKEKQELLDRHDGVEVDKKAPPPPVVVVNSSSRSQQAPAGDEDENENLKKGKTPSTPKAKAKAPKAAKPEAGRASVVVLAADGPESSSGVSILAPSPKSPAGGVMKLQGKEQTSAKSNSVPASPKAAKAKASQPAVPPIKIMSAGARSRSRSTRGATAKAAPPVGAPVHEVDSGRKMPPPPAQPSTPKRNKSMKSVKLLQDDEAGKKATAKEPARSGTNDLVVPAAQNAKAGRRRATTPATGIKQSPKAKPKAKANKATGGDTGAGAASSADKNLQDLLDGSSTLSSSKAVEREDTSRKMNTEAEGNTVAPTARGASPAGRRAMKKASSTTTANNDDVPASSSAASSSSASAALQEVVAQTGKKRNARNNSNGGPAVSRGGADPASSSKSDATKKAKKEKAQVAAPVDVADKSCEATAETNKKVPMKSKATSKHSSKNKSPEDK